MDADFIVGMTFVVAGILAFPVVVLCFLWHDKENSDGAEDSTP